MDKIQVDYDKAKEIKSRASGREKVGVLKKSLGIGCLGDIPKGAIVLFETGISPRVRYFNKGHWVPEHLVGVKDLDEYVIDLKI